MTGIALEVRAPLGKYWVVEDDTKTVSEFIEKLYDRAVLNRGDIIEVMKGDDYLKPHNKSLAELGVKDCDKLLVVATGGAV